MLTLTALTRPVAAVAACATALLAAPALASAATTSTASDTADREVGKTGWYAGFAITLDEVSVERDDDAATIDLKLSYENLIGETIAAPDEAYLEVDGGEVVDLTYPEKKIAGLGKGKGTATGTLDSAANDLDEILDGAVLVYGEADGNQTRIPVAEDEDVESIEPRGVTVGQTIGSNFTATLTNAYLWPSYRAGEKDKYELWVEVDAKSTVGGPGYIDRSNFTVTAPNGTESPCDDRSPWISDVVDSTSNVEGAWMVFVLNDSAKGAYTFAIDIIPTGKAAIHESTTITL